MTRQRTRGFSWRPTREEVVDGGFVAGLLALGLVGLGSVYGGWSYLVVGLVGVTLGMVIAHVGVRLRAPWAVLSLAVLLCYFLLAGAVALRGDGGGPIPDIPTIRSLADVVLNGWKQLISVVPPVGSAGPLLALPYLMGLVGAVLSFSVARRFTAPWAPLLPLLAVLAASILLGSLEPFSLVLQGLLYFCAAALYLTLRVRRRQEVVHRSGRSRLVAPVAMVGVAGLAGLTLAPAMALAGEQDRVVLRSSVVPPFDPHDWVSPLAELRHWELPTIGQGDVPLFTISPVPTTVVRLATMDAYDGVVYNVAGDPGPPRPGVDASSSGWFQPVGNTFPVDPSSALLPTSTYTVSIGQYRGIWLPTIGEPTSISFSGPDASSLASTLRYNSSTEGAVAGLTGQPNEGTLGTGNGTDSYTITTVLPPGDDASGSGVVSARLASDPEIANAGPLNASVPSPTGPSLKGTSDLLAKMAATAPGPYVRASAIATFMSQQSLSSSYEGAQPSAPGHSVKRLADLVATTPWVGNAEQFSALMALLLGSDSQHPVPARVVVGVRHVPSDGVVLGKDVTAWVEVGIAGYGWVPFFPTPATANLKKQNLGQTDKLPDPPPPPVSPHLKNAVAGSDLSPTDTSAQNSNEPAGGLNPLLRLALVVVGVAAIPLALLGIPAAALIALKTRRRRRRQQEGEGSQRIAGGWDEVVDWARDTGREVPMRRTRREVAGALATAEPTADLSTLASRADRAVFAPERPSDEQVEAYWADVATAQDGLAVGLPRWRRAWARVNPTSLRSHDGRGAR